MNFDDTQKLFNEMSFFTLCNAAPGLSKFFKEVITISNPRTELATFGEVKERSRELLYTTIKFNDGKIGETHIFFDEEDALKLAEYAIERKLGQDKILDGLNELAIDTIEEFVNILGGNMTEILNVIYGTEINIDVPVLTLNKNRELDLYDDSEKVVFNTFTLRLGPERKIILRELAKQSYYEDLITQLKNKV